MGLTTRIKLAKLVLITDIRAQQGDFSDFVAKVFDGGVDLIEVRDDKADPKALAEALEVARSIALNRQKGVIVGGNVEVAGSFQADFLHLGAAGAATSDARKALPEHGMVARSVHSDAQLKAAIADPDVTFLFVGPVFDPDPSDQLDFPGLDLVKDAAAQAVPGDQAAKAWFAVGGIDEGNIQQVLDAGALRVAVSSAITKASDPGAAAERLRGVLQQAWDARPELERYVMGAFGSQSGSASFTVDAQAPGADGQPT